jgi:toxin FitB
MFLLDTNVISEAMRERPDSTVRAWFREQSRSDLWTTSVTIAELLFGIESLASSRKQKVLRDAVEGMLAEDFKGKVLTFNLAAARQYAQLVASRQRAGRPIRELDAQIAAIARANGATLVTRNVNDFAACDVPVLNPWDRNAKTKIG